MRSFRRVLRPLLLTALIGACSEPLSAPDDPASVGTTADVITGSLEVAVVDMEDSAYQLVSLRTAAGETLRLRLRDEQLGSFRGGDTVSVLGVRKGDEIDLTAGGSLFPAAAGELGTSRSALVASGPRTVAVVLFNFRNDTSQPLSKAQVQAAVFSAPTSMNAYYQELSNKAISLAGIQDKVNGDAFGYFTISADNTSCSNPFGWTDQVDALAKAQGVDLGQYNHVIYISPDAQSCGWAGIAHLPGRKAIVKASTLTQFPKVITHEFGHNLGFAHANLTRCTEGGRAVPLSATCTTREYGDLLDPMGIGTPRPPTHTNIRNKRDAGWTGARLLDARSSGTYSFGAANAAGNGPQGLRIARSDGSFLWLETRSLSGFDALSISSANHAVYRGVTIRIAREQGTMTSQLVDAVPGTDSVDDAPFLPGTSFADPQSKITVNVLSVSGGNAQVQVDLSGATPPPPPPPPTPPPASTDPVVRVTSVHSGLPLSVVGASKADGAAVEQATYTASPSQHMRLQFTSQGSLLIRPVHSDLCLDIAGSSRSAGAGVVQAACGSQSSQRFVVESAGTSTYRLRNANSNLCLDIAGASKASGARIVQQPCSASVSQSWRLYLPN